MSFITNLLAWPLGYIMWACHMLVGNYGLTIILFTLATKIIMFPLSLKVQKNSISMVKINPKINEIQMKYAGDKEKIADETMKVYEKEGYSPLLGLVPTLIQIPIILGLIDVIYQPLKHLLHFDQNVIDQLVAKACELKGVEELGSSAQLTVVEMIKHPETAQLFQETLGSSISGLDNIIARIQNFHTTFWIWDFAGVPSLFNITNLIWIPILAGVSAWLLCYFQNRDNVLQMEQSKASQYGMTIFLIAFSVYFSFLVPAGVGFYWTVGNLMAIALIYICNAIYNPKEYIDYDSLEKMKAFLAKQKAQEKAGKVKKKADKKREKADYKKFFADESKELVFYSERNGFYKYFSDTMDYILEHSDIVIHYVTSDPDDDMFERNHPRIIPYYVDGNRLVTLFMKMDAKMMAMTMQDLEQFQLKRSYVKKNVEYIYLPHYPLSETMGSRKGSLDHYDTIFCVSRYQMNEIREWEAHFGLKKKRLIEAGYGFLEQLLKQYEVMDKTERERKRILIAPSWQEDNILDSCLHGILKQLLRRGYDVVIRPHPEYVKRYGARMDQIVERYSGYNGGDLFFELDFAKSDSLYNSDLLITDWSGTAYEFAFVTKKPVVFINTPPKIKNPEYTILKNPPMEFVLRDKLGLQVEMDKLEELKEGVPRLLSSKGEYEEVITQLLNEQFTKLGQFGEITGQYMIDRLRKKKKKPAEQKGESNG